MANKKVFLDQESQIIHVTSSYWNVESILRENSLRLKYCQEEFVLQSRTISAAVHPMVCFSEFTSAEMPTREVTYGKYGIAFSKKWVEVNGLHPVLYLYQSSVPAQGLAQLLIARRNKEEPMQKNLKLPIIQLKCFVKNARGENQKAHTKDFNFRSENE